MVADRGEPASLLADAAMNAVGRVRAALVRGLSGRRWRTASGYAAAQVAGIRLPGSLRTKRLPPQFLFGAEGLLILT